MTVFTLDVPGARLNVTDTARTAAPTLLFVHGNVMNLHMWDAQADALQSEFRCVRWDLRLHGETSDDGRRFSYWDAARDGIAVLDRLGIASATWVGHSQGGFTALRAALLAPDRVERLVLVDTMSHSFGTPDLDQMAQVRDGFRAGATEATARQLLGILLGSPPHEHDWLPHLMAQGGRRLADAVSTLMDADDITERLAGITQPALIVHGSADIPIPVGRGYELARDLPGAVPISVLDGCGHTPPVTHPDQMLQAIRRFCG